MVGTEQEENKICILDLKSTLEAIQKGWLGDYSFCTTEQNTLLVNFMKLGFNTVLQWISVHCEVFGNERVDEIEKMP